MVRAHENGQFVSRAPAIIAPPPATVVTVGTVLKITAAPMKATKGSRYCQTVTRTASIMESEKFHRK